MHRFLIVLIALFISFPALAENTAYEMVKEKSSLKFVVLVNGGPLEGRFTDYTATIQFDPEKPESSSIKAEVELASLAMAHEEAQKNISRPEWLSIDAFPKATFVSKTVSRTPGTDDYFADGELTLRGKTQPVMLNFSLHKTGDVTIAKGYATIQRTAFEIGQGDWAKDDVIAYPVRVEFRIFAKKQ